MATAVRTPMTSAISSNYKLHIVDDDFEKSFLDSQIPISLVGYKISIPLLGLLEIVDSRDLATAPEHEGLKGEWLLQSCQTGVEYWIKYGVLFRGGSRKLFTYIEALKYKTIVPEFETSTTSEWQPMGSGSKGDHIVQILIPVEDIFEPESIYACTCRLPERFLQLFGYEYKTHTQIIAGSIPAAPGKVEDFAVWEPCLIKLTEEYFKRELRRELHGDESNKFMTANVSLKPIVFAGWQMQVSLLGICVIVDAEKKNNSIRLRIQTSFGAECWVDLAKGPIGFAIWMEGYGMFKIQLLRKPWPAVWEKSTVSLELEFFEIGKHAINNNVPLQSIEGGPKGLLGFQVKVDIFGLFIVTGMRQAATLDGILLDESEHKLQNANHVALWVRFLSRKPFGTLVFNAEVGYLSATIIEKVTDSFNTLGKEAVSLGMIESDLVRGKIVGQTTPTLCSLTVNNRHYIPHVIYPGMASLNVDPATQPQVQNIPCEWEKSPGSTRIPPAMFLRQKTDLRSADAYLTLQNIIQDKKLEHLIGYKIYVKLLGVYIIKDVQATARSILLRIQNVFGYDHWAPMIIYTTEGCDPEITIQIGQTTGALFFELLSKVQSTDE
jgi:hypothetical protein